MNAFLVISLIMSFPAYSSLPHSEAYESLRQKNKVEINKLPNKALLCQSKLETCDISNQV